MEAYVPAASPPKVVPAAAAPPQLRRDAPPVAVIRPAAPVRPKESRWGLWVAAVILVGGLGGGGWYIFGHRSAPSSTLPETAVPAPALKPPATSGQTPGTSGQNIETSDTGRAASPPQSQPETATDKPAAEKPAATLPQPERSVRAPGRRRERPAVDQRQVRGQLTLGNFYLKDGKYDDAIREYEKGLQLDPSNAQLQAQVDKARKAKAAEERLGVR